MKLKYREGKKRKEMEVLSVGELKKVLDKFPDDTPVGRTGHFGEFNPMHPFDIHAGKAYPAPDGWRRASGKAEEIEILDIVSPDLGPNPD